ncbi:MAG: acyl carrier protein [Lachnospiraceae bacterium]|nr:acyl carrier protein [Lachnospiraceae bacterium]
MLEKMREMIAEQLNCDPAEITADTDLKEDLGADSLDLFELVMALEEEYDIEVPTEELENLTTVAGVMEYLRGQGVED